MALRDVLKNWWKQDSKVLIHQPMDKGRVDVVTDYVPLKADQHYVRLWLAQMFLKTRVDMGKTWFPAVHSLVKFKFGSSEIELPSVIDGTKVGKGDGKGDLVARNFVLAPLLPFHGGTMDIDAGLAAVEGQNFVQDFLKVLGDFSSLLATPQISSVLNVAGPLVDGVQTLFGSGGSHLSFRNTLTGDAPGGYFAVIRADERDIDKNQLYVKDSTLRYGKNVGASTPLTSHDHMLFRLEIIENRDDWDQLTFIGEPMKKAVEALKAQRDEEASSYLRAAIIAVHEAQELTQSDRKRVKLRLREDFDELKKDLGFSNLVDDDGYSLQRSMRYAVSVDKAARLPDPSIEALSQ